MLSLGKVLPGWMRLLEGLKRLQTLVMRAARIELIAVCI